MQRTISSGRGGFDVEAATDLGAARDEVPTVQRHDPDLLLYRKVLRPFVRPFVWPASLIVVEQIVVEHQKVSEHVVEKEKPV